MVQGEAWAYGLGPRAQGIRGQGVPVCSLRLQVSLGWVFTPVGAFNGSANSIILYAQREPGHGRIDPPEIEPTAKKLRASFQNPPQRESADTLNTG